jgi:hypothetical protein
VCQRIHKNSKENHQYKNSKSKVIIIDNDKPLKKMEAVEKSIVSVIVNLEEGCTYGRYRLDDCYTKEERTKENKRQK